MRRRGHADIFRACSRYRGYAYDYACVSEIAKAEESWQKQRKA